MRTRRAFFLLAREESEPSVQSKVKVDLPPRAMSTGAARGLAEGLVGGRGGL